MQFLVLAYDGSDPDALSRRQASRQAHLDGVQAMIQEGSFIQGGAILDDDGNMIGSTLFVEFEDREALDKWLQNDAYVTGNVWQDIDVRPIRLVPMN